MTSIGVDIGALFLKAVRVDEAGRIAASVYERHRGEPAGVLAEALDRLDARPDEPVAFTGCNAELFATQLQAPYRDVTLCQIDAVRRMAPDAFAVMDIGGGSATLIQLDGTGKFEGYSTNSMCAAGTGSFLDEQAGRLGISYRGHQGIPPQSQPSDHRHPLHGVRQERPDSPPAGGLQPDGHVVGPLPRHDADRARHAAQRAAARRQDHPARRRRAEPGSGELAPARLSRPHRRARAASPRRGVWRGALRQAGGKRPGARGPARDRGAERERPISVAAHAREVDAPLLCDRAELRGPGWQRGARHALARGRGRTRLPRHRHRVHQHESHPDRRGGRRPRRHLPEDGRRSHRCDEAAFPRAADAGRGETLGARHRGRGHDRKRPENRGPRHRRRRHHQRDLRARRRRRARRPLRRHHFRDRRAGRQVHARRGRPHPRREHELRVRRRHGLLRRGAGDQARLQGLGGRAGRAGPAAAARDGSLHGVHGAGSRQAHPHRVDAAGGVRRGDGVGGEELPEQGRRQPLPQPREDLLPGRHGAEPRAGGGVRAAAGRGNRRLALLPRDGGVRRRAAHAPRDAGAGAARQRLPRPRSRPARHHAVEGDLRALPEPLRDHAHHHRRRRGPVVGLHVRPRAWRAPHAPHAPQPPAAPAQEALARGRARRRRAGGRAGRRHPAGAEHLHVSPAVAAVFQPPRVPDPALGRHDPADPRSRRAHERGGVLLPGQGVPRPRRPARREGRRRLRLPAGDEERGAERARHDVDLLPVRAGVAVVRPRGPGAERHGERPAALADRRPPPGGAHAAEAPRVPTRAGAGSFAPPDRRGVARGLRGAAGVRAAPARRGRRGHRGGPRQRREAPRDRGAVVQHLRQRVEPGPAGEARGAGADGPAARLPHAWILPAWGSGTRTRTGATARRSSRRSRTSPTTIFSTRSTSRTSAAGPTASC